MNFRLKSLSRRRILKWNIFRSQFVNIFFFFSLLLFRCCNVIESVCRISRIEREKKLSHFLPMNRALSSRTMPIYDNIDSFDLLFFRLALSFSFFYKYTSLGMTHKQWHNYIHIRKKIYMGIIYEINPISLSPTSICTET